LYGAGKHTEWLMNNVLEGTGHYPSVIFDDFPAEKNFFAVPLDRPENITKHNIGIIVISNDYSHYQMYFKLKKLLKASDIEIVDPYQELPGVPFEKLHTLREINWDRITTE
jgi:hypothetical protein